MIKQTLKIVAALALCASPLVAQETYFSYDFEFSLAAGENFPVFEISELNEEGGRVGEWSGDDFQTGDPSSFFATADCGETCDSTGVVENPHDGTMMFFDRPNIAATHLMNLTESIGLPGATFSVTVGTRRTGGGANEPKSYDFFGLDADGNESFRIKILADGATERLGYVAEGQVVKDLPTVEGEDMADDIANTGGPPFAVGDDFALISVHMGSTGYTVEYENLNGSNAYATGALPYNGSAESLAQVGLSYTGSLTDTNQQAGFFIDDTLVTGFKDLLLGDFNFDGSVDMVDFMTLAENYGKNTSQGDFDFNGTVELTDWVGFYAAYSAANAPAGAAAVPEPASCLMLAFGVLGLLGFRQR